MPPNATYSGTVADQTSNVSNGNGREPTKFAVIGLGCRLPGQSNSPQEFFDNLVGGRDCVQQIPEDRWNSTFYVDKKNRQRPGKVLSDQGGFMDHFFDFDHEAFAMSGKEACHIDIQQKILLEVCHQALQDSNMRFRGSKTGVFIGTGQIDHGKMSTHNPFFVNEYTAPGSAISIHSNRVSYAFDLRGPSMSIDTACSSSGTAMHLACQSIESGHCEAAVVGGINMLFNQSMSIAFSQLGVLSPDGRCKSFDADANGYVRSEGCGVVVIKPVEAAMRDGDHIYAVISATTANQDGAQSPSLTMPSTEGQSTVMREAFEKSKVDVNSVFYVEAHATGTLVGDPIEINTIGRMIGENRTTPLRVGSVKSNIGHTECASYIASLIKCCMMLDKGILVPSINFKTPNPKIHFDKYNLQVQQKVEEFDPQGKTMVISSFGFGGSNVCSILEPAPQKQQQQQQQDDDDDGEKENWRIPFDKNVYLVSARTKAALQSRIEQFVAIGDKYDQHRLAYTLNSSYHADSKYVSFALDGNITKASFNEPVRMSDNKRPVCFVFSGQGPQAFDMGRELYKTFPAFRETIQLCDKLYKKCSGISILNEIGLFGDFRGPDEKIVHRIDITLPALIMIQIGLFEMWKSMGVVPDVIVGHSFGEMCALYASGACSLEKIIETTAARAVMMTSLDNQGTMIAMGCGSQQANEMIEQLKLDKIWIAAYNSPSSVTLGGTVECVKAMAKLCDELGIFNRVLNVTNAYHTPLLAPLKDNAIKTFQISGMWTDAPKTPIVSTVTGKVWEGPFPAEYFWDNIEGAVRFEDAVQEVRSMFGEETLFFEMAPHPVLSMSLKQCGVKNALYSLHRKERDTESVLRACANLYVHGHSVNWDVVMGRNERITYLPPYPFQRKRCFYENEFHREERLATQSKPFLGMSVIHARSTWQNFANTAAYQWLQDHVVQGAVIFPAAGYVEMALEALGNDLDDVVIHRAMTVPTDGTLSVMQTVVSDDDSALDIFSKPENGKAWSMHASAKKGTSVPKDQITMEGSLAELQKRCPNVTDKQNTYFRFEVMNLFYGPAFQCIESLWQGDEESVGILSSAHLDDVSEFVIHPAVLDCSFQCFLGALKSSANTFLPTRLTRVHIVHPNATPEKLVVHCKITDMDDQVITGDIVAADAADLSKVIFAIEGFQCTKVATAQNANPLYTTVWQSRELPQQKFALSSDKDIIASSDRSWKSNVVPRIPKLDRALAYYIGQALPLVTELTEQGNELSLDKQRYFQWCRDVIASNPDASENDLQILDELAENGFDLEAQMIRRVGENLSALLLNKKNEVSNIMFGDDLMTRIYRDSITFGSSLDIMADLFEQINLNDNRVIRVLEVGAGTGALTHKILPILHAKFNKRIEYFFTDLSVAFIAQDKTAKQYPFVQYKAIDIDKPLASQGIDENSIDILLGFDVVHTGANLKDSLNNLKASLVPGGLLMLIEPTNVYNYMHFIFGVFREWWGFTDDRQICCLRPGQWEELLPTIGFNSVQSIGYDDHVHSMIVASNEAETLEVDSSDNNDVQIFEDSDPQKFLSFVQDKIAREDKTPLVVVTTDAQMDHVSADFSSILGMARVFANEKQDTVVRMVDISSSVSPEIRQKTLAYVKNNIHRLELETAVRDGKIYVPRVIETSIAGDDSEQKPVATAQQVPYRLEADQPGLLDSLCYRRFLMPKPLPKNHVVVRVMAAPLNFKDVMLAMNMLQIPDQYLGLEFAGVIEDNNGSEKFAVGTPVFGFARHCLASHVIAHQDMIVEKPSNLSFIQAASIPAVFVTSYVALVKKANMRANDNVLIHSAAGGVGQASIQLANWKKANVFATVGSEDKRQFLREKYGVQNFANSHSPDWDSVVREQTAGKGVNIVLNSLSGANIEKGLRALAPFGQFCEIGKRDIVENSPVGLSNFLQNISYFSIHLDLMTDQRPDLVGELLHEVAELFEQKVLTPIVDRVYTADQVLQAFRYMQQGSHMGKIVINYADEGAVSSDAISVFPSSRVFYPQDTYLLVGGVGAVGFEIARWMVEHEGARNLVLTSRSARLEKYHKREIERLNREKGARIVVVKADVCEEADVEKLYKHIAEEKLPAVRGIINLAMVLDDDMIPKITPERLERVLRPKVQGSMNVMRNLRPEDLQFVVFFSSISSVIGNPEQVNYAGGNSFLDGYAQTLANQGFRARVINLGAVDDVGVIATDFRLRKIMFTRGLGTTMTAAQVCETVKSVIQSDTVQHMCVLNFAQICSETPAVAPKLRHLVVHDHSDDDDGDDDDSADRVNVLVNRIGALLMIDPSSIDHDEKLTTYGVDSLLAVEIASLIGKILKVKVSQMEILTGLTINQLQDKL